MAIDFDGANDYVACASGAGLGGIFDAGGSIAAWIYMDAYSADGINMIFDKVRFYLAPRNGAPYSSGLSFWHAFSVANPDWRTAANTISSGVWTHICVTYNAASTANDPIFYINGVLSATTEVAAPGGTRTSDADAALHLGSRSGTNYKHDGRIEDPRAFRRILADQEVAALAGGYRGPLGGEVLWLPMTEVDGAGLSSAAAVVFDLSGNGNHGTPQGACVGAASYAPRMSGWIP